ncbi:MAG: hypothetical protein WBF13_06180, partial [Candidatus Zixiibacteriota bacterium]
LLKTKNDARQVKAKKQIAVFFILFTSSLRERLLFFSLKFIFFVSGCQVNSGLGDENFALDDRGLAQADLS